MQLKQILARDARSATDKAIALYGSDVLIISNHLVNGQTELVVALDLPEIESAASALRTVSLQSVPVPKAALQTPENPVTINFRDSLLQAKWQAAQPPEADIDAALEVKFKPFSETNLEAKKVTPQDARDYLRGREIVDLVRDELALIRREFRLNQQVNNWQSGLSFSPEVQPLVNALGEAAIPQDLRALMLASLQEHATAGQAMRALNAQLTHSLDRPAVALPLKGVHVLAGPSGAGKSLMTARLARHAATLLGEHHVAIISFQDARAGAWSQTQMLSSQLGIDSFRANDLATLELLLNELKPRKLVLIDTPGVQMNERVAEILSIRPDCSCHAVVPADASSATLAKLTASRIAWRSLLISKVDESAQPWALLHFLTHQPIGLSAASDGVGDGDLIQDFEVQKLVAPCLAQLQSASPPLVKTDDSLVNFYGVQPFQPKLVTALGVLT